MDDVAGGEPGARRLDAIFLLAIGTLPVIGKGRSAHRLERGEACAPDRAHHARPVGHVHRGVDRDPDEAHADHAGKARARKPFQPAACPIGTFAEIDRRQLALGPRQFAKEDGWESAARDGHEGLTKLTTRKAAVKQSAFPPSIGFRPHAPLSAFPTSHPGERHRSGCCPSNEAGDLSDGGSFLVKPLISAALLPIYTAWEARSKDLRFSSCPPFGGFPYHT